MFFCVLGADVFDGGLPLDVLVGIGDAIENLKADPQRQAQEGELALEQVRAFGCTRRIGTSHTPTLRCAEGHAQARTAGVN